jgi:hypothetical protein
MVAEESVWAEAVSACAVVVLESCANTVEADAIMLARARPAANLGRKFVFIKSPFNSTPHSRAGCVNCQWLMKPPKTWERRSPDPARWTFILKQTWPGDRRSGSPQRRRRDIFVEIPNKTNKLRRSGIVWKKPLLRSLVY